MELPLSYIPRRLVASASCSVPTEHTEQQSNRATEQQSNRALCRSRDFCSVRLSSAWQSKLQLRRLGVALCLRLPLHTGADPQCSERDCSSCPLRHEPWLCVSHNLREINFTIQFNQARHVTRISLISLAASNAPSLGSEPMPELLGSRLRQKPSAHGLALN